MAVLDQQLPDGPVFQVDLLERVESGEHAARKSLRRQIAKLERELAEVFYEAFPRRGVGRSVASPGGPRLLGLGELEQIRDDLAEKLAQARLALDEHLAAEAEQRRLLERMRCDPKRYKFVRVRCRDIGEGGCGEWSVRPRLGLIGMLMGWWELKLSSGCPLARGLRPRP